MMIIVDVMTIIDYDLVDDIDLVVLDYEVDKIMAIVSIGRRRSAIRLKRANGWRQLESLLRKPTERYDINIEERGRAM